MRDLTLFRGALHCVLRAIAETQKVGMQRGKGMGHRADAPVLILKEGLDLLQVEKEGTV